MSERDKLVDAYDKAYEVWDAARTVYIDAEKALDNAQSALNEYEARDGAEPFIPQSFVEYLAMTDAQKERLHTACAKKDGAE